MRIRPFALLLILALMILMIASAYLTEFSGWSVCGVCGRARTATSIFGLPVFVSAEETSLSRAVERAGIVEKHSHDWIFGHGRGISGVSASGRGKRIRDVVEPPLYGQFLAATARYRGMEEARAWLMLMLNPGTSGTLCAQLDWIWDAPGDFNDRERYEHLHRKTVRFLESLVPLSSGLSDAERDPQ